MLIVQGANIQTVQLTEVTSYNVCYLFAPCMKRVSVEVRQFRAFSHTV